MVGEPTHAGLAPCSRVEYRTLACMYRGEGLCGVGTKQKRYIILKPACVVWHSCVSCASTFPFTNCLPKKWAINEKSCLLSKLTFVYRSVLENFLDTHAFVVAPPREILELRRCRVRAQHRALEGIPFSACENVTAAGMGVD